MQAGLMLGSQETLAAFGSIQSSINDKQDIRRRLAASRLYHVAMFHLLSHSLHRELTSDSNAAKAHSCKIELAIPGYSSKLAFAGK